MSTVIQTIFGSAKKEAIVLLLLNVLIAVTMVAGPWFATAPNDLQGVNWNSWGTFVFALIGAAANAAIGFMNKTWADGRAIDPPKEKV